MAKKRARGPGREPSRAELKAFERRAMVSTVAPERPVEGIAAPEGPVSQGRGVLPPRASRVTLAGPRLSREQELAYIRDDLRAMAILGTVMTLLIIAFALILPVLNL